MSPKQIRRLQIFIILFLSSLTLYVLFKEAEKPIEETLVLNPEVVKSQEVVDTNRAMNEDSDEDGDSTSLSSKESKAASNKITINYEGLTKNQIKVLKDFEKKANALKEKLPRKVDLQKLEDDEVHSIPEELLATGRELGQLKEFVLRYPEFKELQSTAKDFYKSCADDEGHPTSIRSLCLFNRLQLAKNSGEKFDISSYPLEIKQLVLELNPFR